MSNKAIVLLSGGIDSTTCFAIAKSQGFDCYSLSFDYGQRHKSELSAAEYISRQLRAVEHRVLKLPTLGGSALTNKTLEIPDYSGSQEIPITYVPARNTIFLSLALGWAEIIDAYDIFIGVSSIDYSHYPDCRPEYIDCFQILMKLATKSGVEGKSFKIHAPLVTLTKAGTILKGLELGVDYSLTISCYRANEEGKACGSCDSCSFRKRGFREAGVADPTKY